MRSLQLIFFVLIFAGCSDNTRDKENVQDVVLEPVVIDSTSEVADTVQNAFAWLDSLQADDERSRLAAFQHYKKARTTSDGESTRMMSGYIRTYVYSHPKEFLSSYSFMNSAERANVQSDIAYEIHASSNKEYKRDLDEYFTDVTNSCGDCSADLKKLLKDFRSKVEVKVKQFAK